MDGDRVEANLLETDALGGGDAGQHAVEPFAARDFLERFFVERIEADVHALQAGASQVGGLLFEQDAVRGEGEVVDAGQIGQHSHEPGRSARTSGSPPVSRRRCTPICETTRTNRVISSNVRISSRGRNRTFSFGMQ